MPKVSVIIPVYNAEKYLSQCLDSLLNQTLRDIEIICVDDGSTDSSLSLLRKYKAQDDRIKILQQNNQFAGVARNNGMNAATGQYYVFLDADDFFESNMLEEEYDRITAFDADLCICGSDDYDNISKKFILGDSRINHKLFSCEIENKSSLGNNIFNLTTACPWNKMFRADFVKQHNLQFQALPRCNDLYFTTCALFLADKIVGINKRFIHYRVSNSESLQGKNELTPGIFFEALDGIYERLDIKNQPSPYKQAFANIAVEHIGYNLRKLDSSTNRAAYNHVADLAKNQHLDKYGILNKNADYFHNRGNLSYLCRKEIISKEVFNPPLCPTPDSIIHTSPKVSFIVPIFNGENYIETCINALCHQTLSDIEIICIDDASTDNTLKTLREFASHDNRIQIIAHDKNRHQGGARNSGLNIAKGKYTWFVDIDDYIDLNAAEILYNKMEALGNVDVITFNANAFQKIDGKIVSTSQGEITRNWPSNKIIRLPKDSDLLPDSVDGSSVTYFAKREFINQFRFREHCVFEDADFSFKVFSSHANFYQMDYTPYHRYISDSSTTTGGCGINVDCILGRLKAAKEILKIIEEHKLSNDFYIVKWFRRWSLWVSKLYIEETTINEHDFSVIIRNLNKRFNYFTTEDLKKARYREVILPEIIISVTTYPARSSIIHQVIESCTKQTILPNKIHLYVAEEQYPDHFISEEIASLQNTNKTFEVIFCDDLKPHKKYFYAMQNNPESIVITVDDDVYYDSNMVETLLASYLKHPDCISCMHAHTITMYDEITFAPYKVWQKSPALVGVPSLLTLPVGVGGVLYPPHCMPSMTFDKDAITNVCLRVDDLWLKLMGLKNNIKCVLAKEKARVPCIDGSQDDALWLSNVNENRNDVAWRKILDFDNGYTLNGKRVLDNLYEEQCKLNISHNKICNTTLLKDLQLELDLIKQSKSYKIGRAITFFPRKIRGFIVCCKTRGVGYTLRYSCKRLCSIFVRGFRSLKNNGIKETLRRGKQKLIK